MREYGPGHPLVFNHVPKTAGNSLRVALIEAIRPEVWVGGVDFSLRSGYGEVADLRPEAAQLVHDSPESLAADATLVAGHISPGTTMARYPGADHITILRAPQVRVLSQWLHSRGLTELNLRHWGPAADAFRIGWRPLREYLAHERLASNVDNSMTRFFAFPHPLLSITELIDERHDDELFEVAVARLDQMSHVNLTENPAFMDELSAWLGHQLPAVRVNERRSVPERRRPDLAVELDAPTRDLLDHRTRIDARLWQHVAARVLPGVDPAAKLRETVDGTIERYRAMLAEPHHVPLKRRAIEEAYALAVRLDPRRSRRTYHRSGVPR